MDRDARDAVGSSKRRGPRVKKPVKRRKKKAPRRGPLARLPLPKKGEKRHDDRTKYERPREKERLRKEIDH